jgi:hypothetical protein
MAKKTQLNVSIGVDSKGYEKSWDEIIKITQESGNDLEKEAAKMALAVSKKIEKMSPKSQVRQLETLTIKMVEMGMEGTQAFNMVTKSAGTLKATIDDAKGMIDAMRPDAPFNALNTTLGASAQAFAGVQGAMALFGSESEDLQKTLIKVQGAMALAEGFKAIDGLTDGFAQLNMVIKQNPLIAGATVIAAVVGTIIATTDATKKLTETQKNFNDISEKSIANYISEATEVKALSTLILDEKQSREVRTAALEKLQQKYPDYLKNLSIETSKLSDLKKGIDDVTEAIFQRAKVQAALDKLSELGAKQLEVELALQREQEQALKQTDMGAFGRAGFDDAVKTRQSYLKYLQNDVKRQTDEISAFLKKQNQTIFTDLVSPEQTTTTKDKTTKVKKPAKDAGFAADEFFGGKFNATTGETDYTQAAAPLITSLDNINKGLDKLPDGFGQATAAQRAFTAQIVKTNIEAENQKIVLDRMVEMTETVSRAIKTLMVDSISGFSMALGEALGGSQDAMQNFGKQLINSIVGFMENVSKAMIAAAIASDLFQKQLFTNPYGALAAGIALGIAAGIVKSKMTKGVQGEGFAKGGLIGGNSFSGDKLFAPVNSGEIIFNTGQQNELLKMVNNGGSGSGYIAETRISGRDLAIILKKHSQDVTRG